MFEKALKLYREELNDLSIGKEFSKKRWSEIWDIFQEINLLNCGNPTDRERINILGKYE